MKIKKLLAIFTIVLLISGCGTPPPDKVLQGKWDCGSVKLDIDMVNSIIKPMPASIINFKFKIDSIKDNIIVLTLNDVLHTEFEIVDDNHIISNLGARLKCQRVKQ